MGAVLLFSINMKLIILTTCLVLLFATFISAKPTKFSPLCENQVNCFVDPCQVSKCEGYPDATCVADYCGGCFARWYSNGQLLNDYQVTLQALYHDEASRHQQQNANKFTVLLTLAHLQNVKNIPKLFANQIIA